MKSFINVLVLLLAGSAHATAPDQLTQFRLFNQCAPMRLVVERLPDDASNIGLTKETLSAALESRLRAARLYDDTGTPYLYLNVTLSGRAFNTVLGYSKYVCETNGFCGWAETWDAGFVGTASSSAFIRSTVTELMDEFLVEYLKANEAACQ